MINLKYLLDHINPITVAICLGVGYVIKHAMPKVANQWIPLVLMVLGIICALWGNGWAVTPAILAGGIISGLASVGLHEAFINTLGLVKKEG